MASFALRVTRDRLWPESRRQDHVTEAARRGREEAFDENAGGIKHLPGNLAVREVNAQHFGAAEQIAARGERGEQARRRRCPVADLTPGQDREAAPVDPA